MPLLKLFKKYPAYAYLQIGGFISSLANWASFLAMLILLDKLTNSGIALGTLWAASGMIPLIFAYFYGVWIDRLNIKKLIRYTELMAMFGYAMFVLIFFVDNHLGVILFLIARFIVLTAGNINSTCISTVIPEIVDREDLVVANGYASTINSIIRLVGATCGGILIAFVELQFIWMINIIVSFITYLLAVKSQKLYKAVRLKKTEKSFIRDFKEGFRLIHENHWVRIVIFMAVTSGTIIGSFNLMLQQYTATIYKQPDYVLTYLYVSQGITSVCLSYMIAAKNMLFNSRVTYAWIYVCFGLSWMLFGMTTNYVSGIFFLILFAIFGAFNGPYERITMQNEVPFSVRGRVFSMWGTTYSLSIQLGAFLTGVIISGLGLVFVPIITGLFALLLGLYIVFSTFKHGAKIEYTRNLSK